MKQYILSAAAILFMSNAIAQDNSGTIVYEQTVKLDFKAHPELEAFADMMPKIPSAKRTLYYTPDITLYKSEKAPEEVTNQVSGSNTQMDIKMDMPEETVYRDMKAGVSYEQKEFMGREFLVTGDVKQQSWKMTGKQKEISGYPCNEAMLVQGKDTMTAWFTPAIPVAAGPSTLGNLPGMILEANMAGMLELKAISITPGAIDKSLLVKPKGGKKISKEDFEKMVAEKTKEMDEATGGNGDGVRIRIERGN